MSFVFRGARSDFVRLLGRSRFDAHNVETKNSNENNNKRLSNSNQDNDVAIPVVNNQNIQQKVYGVPNYFDEVAESKELIKKVRILCWIMTSPKGHKKAAVVRDTWGRRCNILVIISTEEGKHILILT